MSIDARDIRCGGCGSLLAKLRTDGLVIRRGGRPGRQASMRSEWEALHRGLVQSIGTKEAKHRFESLRRRFAVIARFDTAQALVDYLAHAGGDLDEKGRILADLVVGTRTASSARVAFEGRIRMTWQRVAALGVLIGGAIAAAALQNDIIAATLAGAAAGFAVNRPRAGQFGQTKG